MQCANGTNLDSNVFSLRLRGGNGDQDKLLKWRVNGSGIFGGFICAKVFLFHRKRIPSEAGENLCCRSVTGDETDISVMNGYGLFQSLTLLADSFDIFEVSGEG